jgi:hypothetical protein
VSVQSRMRVCWDISVRAVWGVMCVVCAVGDINGFRLLLKLSVQSLC